jgi:hypothetical protein
MDLIIGRFLPPLNSSKTVGNVRRRDDNSRRKVRKVPADSSAKQQWPTNVSHQKTRNDQHPPQPRHQSAATHDRERYQRRLLQGDNLSLGALPA